jgi:hypothetical protein
MDRQGAAVHPALHNRRGALGRRGLLRREGGRLDLLGFLQPEEKLVDRKGLSTTAEAVTLQLLDDLAKAIALGTLRDQHGLEEAGVIRKRLQRRAHESD